VGVALYFHRWALDGRGGFSNNSWDVESASFGAVVCICKVCSIAIYTVGRVIIGSRVGAVFLAAGCALGLVRIL